MKKQYRQGDVFLKRVENMPKGCKPKAAVLGRHILAEGEATGHHHSVLEEEADAWVDDAGVTYLEVKEALAMLTHQEHAPIELERGFWEVKRQREYSPEAIRNVMD